MTEEEQKYRQQAWRIKLALFLSILICFVLLIIIIVLVTKKDDVQVRKCDNTSQQQCKTSSQTGTINLEEPKNPSVFHDLTKTEIHGLLMFLKNTEWLNLTTDPSSITQKSSFKYIVELYVPKKADVLKFLDNSGSQPPREARVTIFRGDQSPPFVVEYIVGPLPNPTYINPVPGRASIPYDYRPFSETEISSMIHDSTKTINSTLGEFLRDMYDGKLHNPGDECDKHCLQLSYYSQVSTAVSGEEKRIYWLWLSQSIEYFLLNTLDFGVLVNTNSTPAEVEAIWFNGTLYNSVEHLKNEYMNKKFDNLQYNNIWHDDEKVLFSEAKRRGSPFTNKPLRGPMNIQPDGGRYSVEHNHVTYMPWSFDFRMSTAYGPELYDIRYKGERIAYEISLQELCVFYSGNYIMQKYSDFFDSSELMGRLSSTLVPGVDCPSYATFISSSHSTEKSHYDLYENSWCLFELNTGDPLRRHLTDWPYNEAFYEGTENVVLVLRTILTILNYDYVIDFRFYLTGAIQVKLISTGFITTSFYSPLENPYGYRLHETTTGNIHQHLVNWKVDLDIKGTSNRFETLNLEQDVADNPLNKKPDAKYYQSKFSRDLKQTEMDGAYRFNFSAPKYLTILNEAAKNKYGVPPAYRVKLNGMSKVLLEQDQNNEPAATWSRYQMAVTKRKESERNSATIYGSFDSAAPKPIVKFQDFLDDNENIVDEDLVAWISLGMHHIPHTEDLPVTPTPGMDVSFYLLPYNYFPEDPSIASQNSVRIEPKNKNDKKSGMIVDRKYTQEISCYVKDHKFWKEVASHDKELFYDD